MHNYNSQNTYTVEFKAYKNCNNRAFRNMAQYSTHKQTSRTQNLSYKIHVVIKIRYAQDITEIKVNVVHKISTQDIYNFILLIWFVSLLLISSEK